MCSVNEIVMCEQTFSDDERVMSLKSVEEVMNTFSKDDCKGIKTCSEHGQFYANRSGKYKICSSDDELIRFVNETDKKGTIFANNAHEPLSYAAGLISNMKKLITYSEPNGGTI